MLAGLAQKKAWWISLEEGKHESNETQPLEIIKKKCFWDWLPQIWHQHWLILVSSYGLIARFAIQALDACQLGQLAPLVRFSSHANYTGRFFQVQAERSLWYKCGVNVLGKGICFGKRNLFWELISTFHEEGNVLVNKKRILGIGRRAMCK